MGPQANHKQMKHQHALPQISQLQIFMLIGRHLGAKPKMQANHQLKVKLQPNMGPQANHQQVKPNMHQQVNMQHGP